MPGIVRSLEKSLHIRIKRNLLNEYATLIGFAVVIGCGSGLIALFFRYLIWGFQSSFYNRFQPIGAPWTNPIDFLVKPAVFLSSGLFIFLALAIGGLIVGLITYFVAPEVKGHGVPEVMAAIRTGGGRIRPRVVGAKALASAVCIGSGGSAGREGPIVQMGSSLGSTIGQMFHMSDTRVKILLSCGAAGAISATFNAPIAGVLFALELILLEFRTRSFIPLVVSSVCASAVIGIFIPPAPAFPVEYKFTSPLELTFFAVLGVVAGFFSLVFIKSLYGIENAFDRLHLPAYAKPILGSLFLGSVALFYPEILGVGYVTIHRVLTGGLSTILGSALLTFFLLGLLKILATSLTLGSGGSGGVFSPSLFTGAMMGAAFGLGVSTLFPGIVANPIGAYALVGMGAVFAGASRATLTSIVIVFELTGDYKFILPLMLACVISDGITAIISEDTIYTKKLRKKGIRVTHDMETNILQTILVKDAMVTRVRTVSEDTPVKKIANTIILTGFQGFPCLDSKGRLCGLVSHSDVRRALKEGKHDISAKEIKSSKLFLALPDETLDDVLSRMAMKGIGHLPVVDPNDRRKLIGFITRSDIIKAYRKRAMEEIPRASNRRS